MAASLSPAAAKKPWPGFSDSLPELKMEHLIPSPVIRSAVNMTRRPAGYPPARVLDRPGLDQYVRVDRFANHVSGMANIVVTYM